MDSFCIENGLTRYEPRGHALWAHLMAVHPSKPLPAPNHHTLAFDSGQVVVVDDGKAIKAYLPADKDVRTAVFADIAKVLWRGSNALQMLADQQIFEADFEGMPLWGASAEIVLHAHHMAQRPHSQVLLAVAPSRCGKSTWLQTVGALFHRTFHICVEALAGFEAEDLDLFLQILAPDCICLDDIERLGYVPAFVEGHHLKVLARRAAVVAMTATQRQHLPEEVVALNPLVHTIALNPDLDDLERMAAWFGVEYTPDFAASLERVRGAGTRVTLELAGREKYPLETRRWLEESGYFSPISSEVGRG